MSKLLTERVVNILNHPALAPIGFEMFGLVVTGTRYSVVRQAIQSGKITCTAGAIPDDNGKVGYVTIAKYIIRKNILAFPSENYASYRGDEMCTVVHEATHAMFDVFAKSKDDRVLAIRDESCAVLAEMLFYRLSGVKHAPSGLKEVGSASHAALKLADVMLARTGNFRKDTRTYFLTPGETDNLRAAVAADWGFVGGKATTQYVYDGM